MTVPFDPKPSAELERILGGPMDKVSWITNLLPVAAELGAWAHRLQGPVHADIAGRVLAAEFAADIIARSVKDAADALRVHGQATAMVDGDLWHRELAVMHPGDLGIEEKPR